jgi:exopolysaccharide biosynthesis polyprenyl glycosylphosphotransferase
MIRGKQIGSLWLLRFGADFVAIVAAYYTTVVLRFHSSWGERVFDSINQFLGVGERGELLGYFEDFYVVSAARICTFLTALICMLYALHNLYPGHRFIRRRPMAWSVILANLYALVIIYAYFYLRRNMYHPRSMFGTILALNVVFCVLLRGWLENLLSTLRTRFDFDAHRAILVGQGDAADTVRVLVQEFHPNGVEVVARVVPEDGQTFARLLEVIEARSAECAANILILAQGGLSVAEIMEVLELADRHNMSAKVLSDKMNVLLNQAKVPFDLIHGIPLVHFEQPSAVGKLAAMRHAASKLLAVAAMVVVLPLMGIIAALIKLTSRGPVFFVQERIGVNRKPFRMFKFRTMHDRADELQAQVEEFNESGRGVFKMRKDPRITPVGRLLRRFSLDELPQLFNVIRGEMTIVGPRPLPRRDFENYYEDWHYSRHSGMPGLTCLWQVSGRSDLDFHSMCILDVYYLRNQNWILDLEIILRTVWVVVFAKGAY